MGLALPVAIHCLALALVVGMSGSPDGDITGILILFVMGITPTNSCVSLPTPLSVCPLLRHSQSVSLEIDQTRKESGSP